MIRYQNQYGYSVNITPWFDLGYRLIDVELNNSLGGTLAGGVLNLVGSQSNLETQKLREEYYSGTFSILEEGMVSRTSSIAHSISSSVTSWRQTGRIVSQYSCSGMRPLR